MIKQVYEYKELKRTTTEKQRLYTCPDGNAVQCYNNLRQN